MGFDFYRPQLDEVSYVIDDNQLDIGLERPGDGLVYLVWSITQSDLRV